MLKSKALILAKIETTYSVDAVPTAAANAILVEEPEIEVLGKKGERKPVTGYHGSFPSVNIGEGLKITFATEIKGSGTVDTPPSIGVLFRGSGFTETITPATSVDYDPNSDEDSESLTLYFYRHNILHKVTGCRGKLGGPELKAGEIGKLQWEFTGLYQGPVDQSLVAGTFGETTKPPFFVSAAFALDGYAAIIETLKIDCGIEVAKRPSVNGTTGVAEYFIKGHAVTGEVDPEVVALATRDWEGKWSADALMTLTATLGATAGNKLVITAPSVQILDPPKYGDRENVLIQNLPLEFHPDSGNDDVKFSFQ